MFLPWSWLPLSPWHKGHSCFLVHPCRADSARKLLMSWWWWPIISITTLERPQEHHKSAFLKKKVTEQATTLTLTASEPCSLTENMMKEGSTGAMSEYLRCELDELVNEDYISINWATPKGAIVWLMLLVVYWYEHLPIWIEVEERDVYPVRLEDKLLEVRSSGGKEGVATCLLLTSPQLSFIEFALNQEW